MRILKKILVGLLLLLPILAGIFYLSIKDKHTIPIIMYHHIDHGTHHELNTVSPESFEKQMSYLKRNNFNVIRLDDLVEAIKNNQKLSPKTVVLTFDDGYEDNYTYAFPILKKYQYPAIIFIPTDLIDTPGFLTWDQIKLMSEAGIDFGSHTRTHIYLPTFPSFERVKMEIAGSKNILESRLGKKVDYFCYPSGGFSEEIKDFIRETGFKGACTTNRGYVRFNKDVYELKRIRFKNSDLEDLKLWAKLSGYYNFFRKAKAPYAR